MNANERRSFSGHETFPFRYAWPKKAVEHAHADAYAFGAEDALVRFGVGKNMVSSIRHWGLALGLLENGPATRNRRARPLRPTALGRSLLLGDEGWDPYLEDPGTLWLLHWRLASRPERATTWWWVFNQHPGTVFTRVELVEALTAVAARNSRSRATAALLKRDVDVFIRTYAPSRRAGAVQDDVLDCPLVQLALIVESRERQTFQLVRGGHDSLPVEIFASALAEYLADGNSRTVTLEDLLFAEGAPGRVFCLSEQALLRRLDHLERMTDGGVVFDETAGLKQLYVHRIPNPVDLLRRYYASADEESRACA